MTEKEVYLTFQKNFANFIIKSINENDNLLEDLILSYNSFSEDNEAEETLQSLGNNMYQFSYIDEEGEVYETKEATKEEICNFLKKNAIIIADNILYCGMNELYNQKILNAYYFYLFK